MPNYGFLPTTFCDIFTSDIWQIFLSSFLYEFDFFSDIKCVQFWAGTRKSPDTLRTFNDAQVVCRNLLFLVIQIQETWRILKRSALYTQLLAMFSILCLKLGSFNKYTCSGFWLKKRLIFGRRKNTATLECKWILWFNIYWDSHGISEIRSFSVSKMHVSHENLGFVLSLCV